MDMTGKDTAKPTNRNGILVVALPVALIAAIVGYFALGMPGMDMDGGSDTSGTEMPGMDMGQDITSDVAVSVDEFADRMADPEAFVINVHIPFEGRIQGTDASIPFDKIAGDERLPKDKATPLVLYCKRGRMSAVAAATLKGEGYTNIVDLRGGMDAWEAAGRSLE